MTDWHSTYASYLYDRQHVILETRGSDSIRYARGINYIGRIDSTGKLSYYLFNGHGDVVQTVSEAGEIENQYDYDIFGNSTLTVENYLNSIRYAGEFYDSESGLYYLRARYYDPRIGRFISEDTNKGDINNPSSLNLYTYCWGNPIKLYDPDGHEPIMQNDTFANLTNEEFYSTMKTTINVVATAYLFYIGYGEVKASIDALRLARAINASKAADAAVTKTLSGKWVNVNESMSDASRVYQKQITGREGQSFLQNGVKFDGENNGTLIEVKGSYKNFVNTNTGTFKSWFSGKQGLIDQAKRQLNASEGASINWYFSDEASMNATKSLFSENGIKGINFIYEPMK